MHIINFFYLIIDLKTYYNESNLYDAPIVDNIFFLTHFGFFLLISLECSGYLWYFGEIKFNKLHSITKSDGINIMNMNLIAGLVQLKHTNP